MAKLAIIAFIATILVTASAASYGGVKDLAGNYYDLSTGQYSSALTGKVYDTVAAPYVANVPLVASVPAAISNYYAAYPYDASYVAPLWK